MESIKKRMVLKNLGAGQEYIACCSGMNEASLEKSNFPILFVISKVTGPTPSSHLAPTSKSKIKIPHH